MVDSDNVIGSGVEIDKNNLGNFDLLEKRLNSINSEVREEAEKEIPELYENDKWEIYLEKLNFLGRVLENTNGDVRLNAVKKIPKLWDEDSDELHAKKLELLEKAMNDSNYIVRLVATAKIPILGNGENEELMEKEFMLVEKALDDESQLIRREAVRMLPQLNNHDSDELKIKKLEILKKALGNEDVNVRCATAMALSKIYDSDSDELSLMKIELFQIVLNDDDSSERDLIVKYLPKFNENDSDKLKIKKLELFEKALDCDDEYIEYETTIRLPVFQEGDSEGFIKIKIELFEKALSSKNSEIRQEAARMLPELNENDSDKLKIKKLELFEKALDDEEERVRSEVAIKLPDLSRKDNEELVKKEFELLKRALSDKNPHLRKAMVTIKMPYFYAEDSDDLRTMKLELLQGALNDENIEVRIEAVRSLQTIFRDDNDELKKLELLERVLSDESTFVLRNAEVILPGLYKDDSKEIKVRKLRLLKLALGHDSWSVRFEAEKAIKYSEVGDWGEIGRFLRLFDQNNSMIEALDCLEFDDTREYYKWLFTKNHEEDGWLTIDEINMAKSMEIQPLEYVLAKRINFEWRQETDENRWKELIDIFRLEVMNWEEVEGEEVINGFNLFVDSFGYRNAFKYLNRGDVSKHDLLFATEKLVAMYKKSGFSKEQFWGSILNQVVIDDSVYPEGCAQQHLNQIASSIELDLGVVMREAKKYDIPEMDELLNTYSSYGAIFESWQKLRRYKELVDFLGESDTLVMLGSIKINKPELYKYSRELLFHKDSKVSIPAVTKFLYNPDNFLRADDQHAPRELHERKKPSQYSQIPNLDMSGVDLRDSLVEGTMDKVQSLEPLKVVYKIPAELISENDVWSVKSNRQILEEIRKVMAKGREDKEARMTFMKIGSIVERKNVRAFLDGTFLASEEQWKKIRNEYTRVSFSGEQIEIEVQVHRKSDPVAAIAGDDTVNCMPFGSGKNTVYTFNTNTGLMTVRLRNGDRWKTIAESVLTRDIEVSGLEGMNVGSFLKELEKNNERLDLTLPEEVLEENKEVIPMIDNIEVAKNYQEIKWQKIIKALYSDFWSVYLNKEGVNFANEGKIRAGLGYDDLGDLYDDKENTRWIPRAMVSYSDAIGSKLGVIKTENVLQEYRAEIIEEKTERIETAEISERGKRNGVRYATVDDALAVGWLESRVYNESGAGDYVEGGAAMENMLIATEINNVRKNRPQMSLVHIGEKKGKKVMDGYLMAYQGKLYGGSAEMADHVANGVLYIEDMAVRQEAQIGAGAMLAEFMELYRKNYLEKDKLIPIYMQARESTSFALVQKQLENMARNLGLKVKMIGDTKETGQKNLRHSILLVPMKE